MPSENNTRKIAGTAVLLIVFGVGAWWFDASRNLSAPQNTIAIVMPAADAPAADTAPADQTADNEEAAPNVNTDPVEIADMAPAIDTFFRNPDETTVIAGRATPGQTIAVILAGEEVARVDTAADGTFGTVIFVAASDQPRRLRLLGDPDGKAIASAQSIIVPPSAPVAVASATPSGQAAPEIATNGDGEGTPAIDSDTAGQIDVTASVGGSAAAPAVGASPLALNPDVGGTPSIAAPPTLIADADGVRVIQRGEDPTGRPAAPLDSIALDTITYDPAGEVVLSGRAKAGGFVQIYLDNRAVTTSRITADGDWQIDLPNVDTGVYTLRVDEVDDEGNVQSRIETPFKREEPGAVAAILAEETAVEGFDVAVKTVQPGSTLWAIAEEQLGDGILYVAVFEANRDLIRNPDLIYPGQVFRIPELPE